MLSPIVKAAEAAFQRDLPILLKGSPGKWVAYHGSVMIAISKKKVEIYRKFDQKEHPLIEVLVRKIVPNGPPINMGKPRRVARQIR